MDERIGGAGAWGVEAQVSASVSPDAEPEPAVGTESPGEGDDDGSATPAHGRARLLARFAGDRKGAARSTVDHSARSSARRSHGSARRSRLSGAVRELAVLLLIALAISVLLRAFVVQAFFIPSGSMEETLVPDERVLVSKLTPRFSDVERGQIVVFRDPGGWLPDQPEASDPVSRAARDFFTFVGVLPSDTGHDLIKRVIGVGGDRVVCCDAQGRITVNGQPLDEPYLFPGDSPSDVRFDVTVPDDHLWLMGDHRSQSGDSREHLGDPGGGAVPVNLVVGRAFVVVWPVSSAQWLRQPATFDQLASTG
jgi:signal peptidase I